MGAAHVVIFPLPIQGPVNCMLKLSQLILSQSEAAISITFLTTDFIHGRLSNPSKAVPHFAEMDPNIFRFETVSDGLGPVDNPRGAYQLADMTCFLEDQALTEGSKLRQVLCYGSSETVFKKGVSCIIADGFFGFMVDVAKELKIPVVYFDTISPSALWTYLCVPNMLAAAHLPFQGNDLDATVTSVPGMEAYLRRRDLPSFCRTYDPKTAIIQLVLNQAHNFPRAQGHILNTFDELEGDYFPHLRALCPNLYNIGPLHLHLKCRMKHEMTNNLFSNSLWEEDRMCLNWLDEQPQNSVIFVSIGSLAVITREQLIEIWFGLVNSKVRFLWVQRPNSIMNDSNGVTESQDLAVPKEVIEGTKERGCIVSWAPQEEVLSHKAIGGFMTHSGWNSTLESIVEGVPMLCWPFFVDQQVNSRLVNEVWKIGLDMKDKCDRVVIEKMIKELMENQRDMFLLKANEWAKLATKAVSEDGSSYNSLNRLIEDIRFMRFSIPL
ncbi:unnamed protein product [Amaranthus hypochondriacus]